MRGRTQSNAVSIMYLHWHAPIRPWGVKRLEAFSSVLLRIGCRSQAVLLTPRGAYHLSMLVAQDAHSTVRCSVAKATTASKPAPLLAQLARIPRDPLDARLLHEASSIQGDCVLWPRGAVRKLHGCDCTPSLPLLCVSPTTTFRRSLATQTSVRCLKPGRVAHHADRHYDPRHPVTS